MFLTDKFFRRFHTNYVALGEFGIFSTKVNFNEFCQNYGHAILSSSFKMILLKFSVLAELVVVILSSVRITLTSAKPLLIIHNYYELY